MCGSDGWPGRPTSGSHCQAGRGACGGDRFECSGEPLRLGNTVEETITLLVEPRPRYLDQYGCRPIKERTLIKIAKLWMIASALAVVAACSQSRPPPPPEPLPMAAPVLPPEAPPYVAPGRTHVTRHHVRMERRHARREARHERRHARHERRHERRA